MDTIYDNDVIYMKGKCKECGKTVKIGELTGECLECLDWKIGRWII
jgi:hypothetical protein